MRLPQTDIQKKTRPPEQLTFTVPRIDCRWARTSFCNEAQRSEKKKKEKKRKEEKKKAYEKLLKAEAMIRVALSEKLVSRTRRRIEKRLLDVTL